jgi:hypothetical protein
MELKYILLLQSASHRKVQVVLHSQPISLFKTTLMTLLFVFVCVTEVPIKCFLVIVKILQFYWKHGEHTISLQDFVVVKFGVYH